MIVTSRNFRHGAKMAGFHIGTQLLAQSWEPLIHPTVRALNVPAIAGIDCDNCLMVSAGLFPERSKCCNYLPDLPNFLVGEILDQDSATQGRQLVADWIARGRGDPLFVYAPPRIAKLHREATQTSPQNALGCPLLDASGRCTIYAHRPYLCVGYHCLYPPLPEVRAFFSCLASLLALHTAVAAQYLLVRMGIDRETFSDAWASFDDERQAWTTDDGLERTFANRLWQTESDPRGYYRRCYGYVMDHRNTIRLELDQYRRKQLLRRSGLSATRRQQIETVGAEPRAARSPASAHQQLLADVIIFGNNPWTIPEHEGLLLGYYDQLVSAGWAPPRGSSGRCTEDSSFAGGKNDEGSEV